MTTFTYHHSSLMTFGFEKYKIRIYLHVLHVPSLLISPSFRVIWGSHRYTEMFFLIFIQTSSVLATWIGCLSFSGIPGPIFSSRTRIITRTRLLKSDTNLNRIRIAAVGSDLFQVLDLKEIGLDLKLSGPNCFDRARLRILDPSCRRE